ncbi:MAG: hypothetical protein GYB64_09260 [Chloroflexi bacterium]|nr:hypothetical protein [Chloroflexota bacterium]
MPNFFEKLFGGGEPEDSGVYVYVKLHGADEIVRLRLEPKHELIPDDDGFYSRKSIVGPDSFKRAQATFYFNRDYKLVRAKIEGGDLSTEDAWQAYLESITQD